MPICPLVIPGRSRREQRRDKRHHDHRGHRVELRQMPRTPRRSLSEHDHLSVPMIPMSNGYCWTSDTIASRSSEQSVGAPLPLAPNVKWPTHEIKIIGCIPAIPVRMIFPNQGVADAGPYAKGKSSGVMSAMASLEACS
jgi:hypothetical protein